MVNCLTPTTAGVFTHNAEFKIAVAAEGCIIKLIFSLLHLNPVVIGFNRPDVLPSAGIITLAKVDVSGFNPVKHFEFEVHRLGRLVKQDCGHVAYAFFKANALLRDRKFLTVCKGDLEGEKLHILVRRYNYAPGLGSVGLCKRSGLDNTTLGILRDIHARDGKINLGGEVQALKLYGCNL